jgi:hypothetical protein
MGNIEKKITEILQNKTVTEASSDTINPKVQSFLDECDRIINILMDDDLFKQEQTKHSPSLTEGLSPEVSNKAKAIFKSMIADKRDVLFKRYGAEAEKVAYGRAIAKAKQEMENKTTQNEEKLREMVRTALSTPIDSTAYMDERMALSEDDWQQSDDESSMAKSQLQSLIRDAQNLEYMIQDNEQLDAWVQSKITKAQDYIASVYNYMKGETEQDKQTMSSPLAERIFNRIKNRM